MNYRRNSAAPRAGYALYCNSGCCLGVAARILLARRAVLESLRAGVADARGRRTASNQGGYVGKAIMKRGSWNEKQDGTFQFSAFLSVRVRDCRPAFCVCQKAALWCSCAGCAVSRGKADMRRTARIALAPGDPTGQWCVGSWVVALSVTFTSLRNLHPSRWLRPVESTVPWHSPELN